MEIIDLSTGPTQESTFLGYLDTVCDTLGFDYAAYANLNPLVGATHGFVNYPDAWKVHYTDQGFHMIDPTLRAAARSIAPVDWDRLKQDGRPNRVLLDARDFGITDRGLTVPVRGPHGDIGLFSVTRDCSEREWALLKPTIMRDLHIAAVHLHDSVMQSDTLMRALRFPALSNREREILQWIAAGKTQVDVSDILMISHRTVEVHLRSAREKLRALTTAQAVGRAVSLGLVQPG